MRYHYADMDRYLKLQKAYALIDEADKFRRTSSSTSFPLGTFHPLPPASFNERPKIMLLADRHLSETAREALVHAEILRPFDDIESVLKRQQIIRYAEGKALGFFTEDEKFGDPTLYDLTGVPAIVVIPYTHSGRAAMTALEHFTQKVRPHLVEPGIVAEYDRRGRVHVSRICPFAPNRRQTITYDTYDL